LVLLNFPSASSTRKPPDRAHPFRYAVADDKTIREPELRRLAGDELSSAPRSFARTNFDVEPSLLVEAFVLRDQETCIWSLVEPVEPHAHLTFRLREAAMRKRDSRKTGRDADPM
jgi:hypothetical protein